MKFAAASTGVLRPLGQAPLILGGLFFIWLFWEAGATLLRDWWNDPEAGHGLLLGPLSFYLIYRTGLMEGRRAQPALGLTILALAVALRLMAGLAAELFTLRMSLIGAAIGIAVFLWGVRQVLRWWLPVTLLVLSVPIPSVILTALALPLQLQASQLGAALLAWRDVPVMLSGNVIQLPGQSLFVAEACSGLRSLTALLSLGILIGGLWLRLPVLRVLLVFATIPVAMLINGVRVFLTGFLVFFVDPRAGEGFMHLTEGWLMFIVAFAILGVVSWALTWIEGAWFARRRRVAEAA